MLTVFIIFPKLVDHFRKNVIVGFIIINTRVCKRLRSHQHPVLQGYPHQQLRGRSQRGTSTEQATARQGYAGQQTV